MDASAFESNLGAFVDSLAKEVTVELHF